MMQLASLAESAEGGGVRGTGYRIEGYFCSEIRKRDGPAVCYHSVLGNREAEQVLSKTSLHTNTSNPASRDIGGICVGPEVPLYQNMLEFGYCSL